MVKVEIEIKKEHWALLQQVSKKLDLDVKRLLQLELDHALTDIEIWFERLS